MRSLIFLISCLVLFFSCDPIRHIKIKNDSSDDLEVKLIGKSSPANYNQPQSLNTYFLYIPIKEERDILFSLGEWNDETLKSFCNSLDSIIIKNKDFTQIYHSQNSIYNFLKNHKGNFLNKHAIVVKVKD